MSLTFTSVAGKPLTNASLATSETTRLAARLDHYYFSSSNDYVGSVLPSTLMTTFFYRPRNSAVLPSWVGPVLGGLPVERQGRTLVKQGLRLSGFNPQLYLRLL